VVVEATALANLWRSGEYRPFSLQQAVEVCADMLLACRCSGIPVVRLGLQQDPSLEVNLLAGPYHPAFGQLVRSQLWRRAYMALPDRRAAIDVNPYDFSDALGHGGQNRNWLESERPHQLLRADSTVPLGGLRTSGQTWMVDDLARQVNSHGS
jgi:hypothetical protein